MSKSKSTPRNLVSVVCYDERGRPVIFLGQKHEVGWWARQLGFDPERGGQINYVLAPFAADEQATVETAVTQATDAVLTAIREGIDIAMNRYNRRG